MIEDDKYKSEFRKNPNPLTQAEYDRIRRDRPELLGLKPLKRGTYVGPLEVLKGQTALLKDGPLPGTVAAQFNNLELGLGFTHTWLMFVESDFCWDQDFDDV